MRTLFRPFGWRKLPGLALAALGLIWRGADYFGRLDVLARAAESVGGTPAMAVPIVSSIWFSIGLVVAGVAYIVFVGEPNKGTQAHPALPYLAWITFFICATTVASVTIYGFYELQMRKAYAAGLAGIPRNSSPANPASPSNQRPLYSDAPRSLTQDQQRLLIANGSKVHDELKGMQVSYFDTDNEAFGYAASFRATLARAAIPVGLFAQPLGDPNREGIMIEVPDSKAPPPEAVSLQQLLLLADISAPFVDETDAAKNYPMVLFIGPRPLAR